MMLRNFLILVMVLSIVPLVFSGCSKNNGPSSSQSSNAAGTVPGLRLQRVFENVDANSTVLMLQAPDNNSDWYIVEKTGRVLRVANNTGANQVSVFLDITGRVDSGPNEAGLLGMVFHPQYANNGLVYLSYTASGSPLTSIISRVTRRADGNALNADSETILLSVDQPYSNHNGGHIEFGPDGYLYIGLGDGGSGGDPRGHGQNVQTLLGSLLRIDVNKGARYAIPASNPFAAGTNGQAEIYAWGLRNPWRWSFDKETGDLWVADVGQNSWEEVNIINAPGNFGWNKKEGSRCYQVSACASPDYIDPVLEYSHDSGCSVTGGFVYRGQLIPSLRGTYLYSDYCSGIVWGAKKRGDGSYESFQLLQSDLNVASFAQGNDGEIYIIHIEGEFYKLVAR